MAGEENGDRDRDVDGERDEHPHPVAAQNPSARARVEIGLHVNVEKPFRAAEQRLASATDATVDAYRPKQNVVDYGGLLDIRLFAFFRYHAQLSRTQLQNLARRHAGPYQIA